MSRSSFYEDHPETRRERGWFHYTKPSLDWAFGVLHFGRLGIPGSLIVIPYGIVLLVLLIVGTSAMSAGAYGPGGLIFLVFGVMLGVALLVLIVWGVYGLVRFYIDSIRQASDF